MIQLVIKTRLVIHSDDSVIQVDTFTTKCSDFTNKIFPTNDPISNKKEDPSHAIWQPEIQVHPITTQLYF